METSPEDLTGLRAFLAKLIVTEKTDELLDIVLALVARLMRNEAKLTGRLAALLRGHAGGGTERFGSAQLLLWKDALDEAAAEEEEKEKKEKEKEEAKPEAEPEPKVKPKRLKLPASLPHRTVKLPVEPNLRICSLCGANKVCIGHESSEVLELHPAHFEVIVYEREKLACPEACPESVVVAPAVVKPLDGGIPGPGLLADIVIRKAIDHTPINRILGIYRRLGVDLPEGTVYGWWDQVGNKLRPLAEAIWTMVLGSHLAQADDTGLRVLDTDTPDGSRRGHMWGILGDGRWARYRFTPTWKGDEMAAFLGARSGWLQGDGYAGYEQLYRKKYPCIEVGCWCHARRYFVKAEDGGDKRARRPLAIIGELFAVEKEAKGLPHEERLALRQARSRPILDRLWKCFDSLGPTTTPKSPLGKAHTYLTNQRRALERFLEDGRLPLENNACELLMRHVAVGRKNWLHCGSDKGADRLADIYTVLVTAKLQGADLAKGLAFVFEQLGRRAYTVEEARELLPDRWPKAQSDFGRAPPEAVHPPPPTAAEIAPSA
jgi:transposase